MSNNPLTRMTTAMTTNTTTMIGRESRTLVSVEGFRTGWRKGSSVRHSHLSPPLPFRRSVEIQNLQAMSLATQKRSAGSEDCIPVKCPFLHGLAIFLPRPPMITIPTQTDPHSLVPNRREDQNCTRRVHPQLPKPSCRAQRLLAT